MAEIILGGGCFWCVEGAMKGLRGVTGVTPGYAGGDTQDPSYEEVCTGKTGHAEVVKVCYDEQVIPTITLLEFFFTIHDATQLNRQGGDVGTQYRSLILYEHESQKWASELALSEAQTMYTDEIVTQISEFGEFYPAEEYHHDYFANNPSQPYCIGVVGPKLRKARALHSDLYL